MTFHPKRCTVCGLSSRFPGVTIRGNVCNYCRARTRLYRNGRPSREFCYTPPLPVAQRNKYLRQMEEYFTSLRQGKGVHGVVAYSGGVDSTYVLQLLTRKYRLNVVPVTIDMGYLNANALKNIRLSVKRLGIRKHLIVRNRKELFRKTNGYFLRHLEQLPLKGYNTRACMVCHHMMDMILYRAAHELGAGFIASGLDRFQTPPELNFLLRGKGFYASFDPEDHLAVLTKFWPEAIWGKVLSGKDKAFLRDSLASPGEPIRIISPTWFLDYDKKRVARGLVAKHLMVTAADTNCTFLPVANYLHEVKFGYGINEFVGSSKVWEQNHDRLKFTQKKE